MKINEIDAVEHIINSLDSGSVTDWFDEESGNVWSILTTGPGEITIDVYDENDEEIASQTFRLVIVE